MDRRVKKTRPLSLTRLTRLTRLTLAGSNEQPARPVTATMTTMAAMAAMWASACNLGVDLEQYPYLHGAPQEDQARPDLARPDQPSDMPPGDQGDQGPDLGPDLDMSPDLPDLPLRPRGPWLIFTELMIHTDKREVQSVEPGEYIEVANIGDEPALLSRVQIKLDTSMATTLRVTLSGQPSPEEQRQFEAISAIAPGQHFVFVRRDDEDFGITATLSEGQFFQWGWSQPNIALANDKRQLQLLYDRGVGVAVQDTIEWTGRKLLDPATMSGSEDHPVRINQGLMRDSTTYLPAQRRSLQDWCLSSELIPGKTGLQGTPGRPATCPRD